MKKVWTAIFLSSFLVSLFFVLPVFGSDFTPSQKIKTLKEQANSSLNKTGVSGPSELIGNVVKIFISFAGGMALVWIIVAGVMWMVASGNSEKVDRAKNIIIWAIFGLIVTVASYIILSKVFEFVKPASTPTKSAPASTQTVINKNNFC